MKKIPPSRYQFDLATLGESNEATTCSMLEANKQGFSIKAFCGSFEDAITLVKSGIAQAALVPGAFAGIGKFLQDPDLYLARCFAAPIPALVLAAKPKARGPFREIYAHPATKPFWSSLTVPVIEAASNDVAAAAVKGKRVACITNEAAAMRFGLRVLHVFRPSLPMSWNIFVRNNGGLSQPPGAAAPKPTPGAPPAPVKCTGLPELSHA